MQTTKLVVKDQVNVRFEGLDPVIRRKLADTLKFMIPNARHMPMYKLGRWDGTVSFCTAGGATYLNLIDRLLPILDQEGYEIDLEDRRPFNEFVFPEVKEDYFADKTWPVGHDKAGKPIILMEHQVRALNTYLDNLQSIQEISTGAGKTIMCAVLSSVTQPYGRSIIVVPSKSLVLQTEEDYKNVGLDVGVFFGDRKEWNHKHTICTWQSLSVFSKRTKKGELEIPIEDFVKDVVCVMIDEVHTAKANELKNLLTGPLSFVPIRWGMTGTVPPEDYAGISLLASIGPMVGEIRAVELQKIGKLANCHVDVRQLIDDHVEYSTYDSEHEFLLSDDERMDHLVKMIKEITDTGNTLVLVDRINAGKQLQKCIEGSVFVYGVVKAKARQVEYKSLQEADEKLIIATYGVASVGINIARLFNVVLIEPGKSFTRVIQSIGRGLRMAHDKDFIHIIDVCSTLKYSKRHLSKRKAYYANAEYPFTTQKVTYR
jgi:superfamily II DNA or RNA helicase